MLLIERPGEEDDGTGRGEEGEGEGDGDVDRDVNADAQVDVRSILRPDRLTSWKDHPMSRTPR